MIVIENRVVDFQAITDRKQPVQIHQVFSSFPPRIKIKDIYFVDDNIEAKYLLIWKTTSDSPEELEDTYLEVSENGSSIPVGFFDVEKHKLEIELIQISNNSNRIPWIRIEFDQLA